MKIGHTADKTALASSATPTSAPAGDAAAAKSAAPGKPADASAKVELSNTAATLMSGEASSAEFDAAKVERISKAIADGSFQVNAEVIADKLIANAQELLGKAPH